MMKLLSLSLATAFALYSCSTTEPSREVAASGDDRGSPAHFDPGPEKGSKWAELFGSTPNYRGIGDSVLGGRGEKFRWQFGPMWYRGRLKEDEVKVFVVGQEGAQDENISNRAFTGSTGTKTQNFLNSLGIRYSYLFLNTFVYTINGQLTKEVDGKIVKDPKFAWLEQGIGSPLVDYRHKLFDHMAETNRNTLALMIGVGSGGKASLKSWIIANGGQCPGRGGLEKCDLSALEKKFRLKKKLLAIGVPHPGGASPRNGGDAAIKNIIRGFDFASKLVNDRVRQDRDWLPEDYMDITRRGAKARRENFRYTNAPVPHWDFAFGTNWRMGKKGTSSNRQGTDSIQIFSDDGKYNAEGDRPRYENLFEPQSFSGFTESGQPIPEMMDYNADGGVYVGDLPYESPKFIPRHPDRVDMFDYGPCGEAVYFCELSELMMGEKSGYSWPDFRRLGVTQHMSFGHGTIYRGRLNKARVLVLADQMSHDDLFSGRALTGDAGQKLQTFLYAAGLTESYAIIRTLPVDTLDLDDRARERVVLDSQVSKVRTKILQEVMDQSKTQVVLTFGRFAEKAIESMSLGRVKHFHLVETTDKNHVKQWNEVLRELKNAVRGDVQALASYSGKNSTINRHDLPVHTRWWMGSTGNRARRATESGRASPDYYMVTAPKWVKTLRPVPARVRVPSKLETFVETEPSDATDDEE